ncbi:MAG: hypothetical protein ACFFAO_14220, partial [Candidatus Hermodarchaeota archaeon]
MSICKKLTTSESQFKIKVGLLGNVEKFKNEFQKRISSDVLHIDSKENIGVSVSKINYFYDSHKFEFYLWNINCKKNFAYIRTIFYHGTEAMIIFISESNISQIKNYFEEIKLNLPVIQIYFCIILESTSKNDLISRFSQDKEFSSLIKSNNIRIRKIETPKELFEQISNCFMIKRESNKEHDYFTIDLIHFNTLIKKNRLSDKCNDYCEPRNVNNGINQKRRIKKEIILNYLSELGYKIENQDHDCFTIKNNKFGIFSILLNSGKVMLKPITCINCKIKTCPNFNKEYIICIEQETKGWSNDSNLDQ